MLKAVYYPRITYTETITPFGAWESDNPDLYAKKIEDRPDLIIVRIDTLDSLRDIWGDNVLQSRSFVYELVSGNCTNERMYQLIQSFYQKYPAFSNYIAEKILLGDTEVPAITRLFAPVRRLIDQRAEELTVSVKLSGGKFLMRTHDYIYAAYKRDPRDIFVNVKGVTIIHGL